VGRSALDSPGTTTGSMAMRVAPVASAYARSRTWVTIRPAASVVNTPIPITSAKPFTSAPANQYSTTTTIRLVTLPSMIALAARLMAVSMASASRSPLSTISSRRRS